MHCNLAAGLCRRCAAPHGLGRSSLVGIKLGAGLGHQRGKSLGFAGINGGQFSLGKRRIACRAHHRNQRGGVVIKLQITQRVVCRDAPHGGEHLRRLAAHRAKPFERAEELGMPRNVVLPHPALEAARRHRVDQPVHAEFVGSGKALDRPFRRAWRRHNRQPGGIDAVSLFPGPGDEILGIDRPGEVVVQVAALGHAAQQHAQGGRAGARRFDQARDGGFARRIVKCGWNDGGRALRKRWRGHERKQRRAQRASCR